MLMDLLTIKTIEIVRHTHVSNGMGGYTTTTSLNPLTAACIYQNNGSKRFLNDRINTLSTHILLTDPSFYSWTQNDIGIMYNTHFYKLTTPPENIMNFDDMLMIGLELTQ
jgi:hypothetical protein